MNLKELGMRFALSYLMSRSTGASQKDSAVDSLIGSTIAQAREDITGFTPEVADVTTQVVSDLVAGKRANTTHARIGEIPTAPPDEVLATSDKVTDPSVGLTEQELTDEVMQLQEGVSEAYSKMLDLDRLKAGVLRRE